jgi:2-polyprenyl-3-methyl-5-hydroxy-6-metoxy-1,4-benzoquinol methylase
MLGYMRRLVADTLTRRRDLNGLYQVLYDQVHDLERSTEIRSNATAEAFGRQWRELPSGEYLLSDPWFRQNVDRILCEQEILLAPEWFPGKRVLDAGCGNGRWTYGLSKLGATTTSVDVNDSALEAASAAAADFSNERTFIKSPLEDLDVNVPQGAFDLVFCWGVAHHCVRFNKVLDNLTAAVKPGGVIYLYLYGKETVSLDDELRTFRDRIAYNVLMDDAQRTKFLLRKAHGNRDLVHSMHDIYAPLINRRFTFAETAELLSQRGFTDATQTISHTEVFVRATRGDVDLSPFAREPKKAPYWFEGHNL